LFDDSVIEDVDLESSSAYEAVILTPEQTFTILNLMQQPESTMTILVAATGLRFSEMAGLQWRDIDYADQRSVWRILLRLLATSGFAAQATVQSPVPVGGDLRGSRS
jgi:integrase